LSLGSLGLVGYDSRGAAVSQALQGARVVRRSGALDCRCQLLELRPPITRPIAKTAATRSTRTTANTFRAGANPPAFFSPTAAFTPAEAAVGKKNADHRQTQSEAPIFEPPKKLSTPTCQRRRFAAFLKVPPSVVCFTTIPLANTSHAGSAFLQGYANRRSG
jgi:hypothetical protein